MHHQAPRIWPDLVNSEPLGQSLLKAIQAPREAPLSGGGEEMRNLNSPPVGRPGAQGHVARRSSPCPAGPPRFCWRTSGWRAVDGEGQRVSSEVL